MLPIPSHLDYHANSSTPKVLFFHPAIIILPAQSSTMLLTLSPSLLSYQHSHSFLQPSSPSTIWPQSTLETAHCLKHAKAVALHLEFSPIIYLCEDKLPLSFLLNLWFFLLPTVKMRSFSEISWNFSMHSLWWVPLFHNYYYCCCICPQSIKRLILLFSLSLCTTSLWENHCPKELNITNIQLIRALS